MKFSTLKRSLLMAVIAAGLVSSSAFTFGQENIETLRATRTEHVNDLFTHQWVTANESGDISGSIVGLGSGERSSASPLYVYLVRNSQIVQKVAADAEGRFELRDVTPGTFSLIARSSDAVGAFSLSILSRENGGHLSSDVEVPVVIPASKVSEIVRNQTIPRYAARVEPSMAPAQDPLGPGRSFASSRMVMSDNKGRLVGKIGSVDSRDVSGLTVFILRDGAEVAKTTVGPSGEYAVSGLQPGVYGFVAAGEAGVVATSFELVPYKVEQVNIKGERLIAQVRPSRALNAEVVPYQDAAVIEVIEEYPEEVIIEPMPGEVALGPQPFPGYGMGYGYGGGGGFGGGGGGFGGGGAGGWAGLAGIAGLATVAGIVAANDDNGSGTNSPN